ncbi:MSHA biogenesis protein MshF [Shewanella sp. HL-SH8]|uniref:MSHA biogenesis protein MshF n=1 Tax=Shewanella sp. HL-SH8 TaxID=3436242 RepID=UPI003EB9D37E
MLKQQKADDDLLKIYGRIVAISIFLLVLAVLGIKYFNAMPAIAGKSLALEHTRFLNITTMIKSQWLSSGRPKQLLLNWPSMAPKAPDNKSAIASAKVSPQSVVDTLGNQFVATDNWISLSDKGWPVIDSLDVLGCKRLWYQLLATQLTDIEVSYDANDKICRYTAEDSANINYQFTSGQVLFFQKVAIESK